MLIDIYLDDDVIDLRCADTGATDAVTTPTIGVPAFPDNEIPAMTTPDGTVPS